MSEWFKRRLESFADNVIFAVCGAGGITVWSAVMELPLPLIVLIFVLSLIVILISMRLIWTFKFRPKLASSVSGYQETSKAMADIINNLTIEVSPYRDLVGIQKDHEEQWLRPVIEWIDFTRPRLSPNKIILTYQIDSGLLYDFKPYRMWIKLRIGQYEPKDGWEIIQTPNLLKCRRSQFASEEFTVRDDDQLKIIEGCRQGLKIAQTLKIILQLREGEALKVLEGSYSINPYSEFVQEGK